MTVSPMVTEEMTDDLREMFARTRKSPISLFLEMYMQVFKTTPDVMVETIHGEEKGTFSVRSSRWILRNPLKDLEFKQETTFSELLRKHTYAKFYG
ncbi:hypothetical protein COOONC_05482 [Cooperia oncophora]